ncbi:MAG: DUF2283 domain-containing protein [Caldilineaceae bacterium]
MKAIHYDAEGDILSVTFSEATGQNHSSIELSDNIVLYYNSETEKPLQLILVSYQAMVEASQQTPILLDGLAQAPAKVQATITTLLQQRPLTAFLQLMSAQGKLPLTSRLQEVFTPTALQMVAAH